MVRPKNAVAAMAMFAFAAIALFRWFTSSELFFLLLGFRDLVASYFFLVRTPEAKLSSSWQHSAIAYISSAIPLVYFSHTTANESVLLVSRALAILGFLLVTLATIDLGTSLGVAPATRKLSNNGVYRFLNHPMYLGYAIAEFGLALINPINIAIFTGSVSFYFLRSRIEEKYKNRSV